MTTLVCSLLAAYHSLPSLLPVCRLIILLWLYFDGVSSLHFTPLFPFLICALAIHRIVFCEVHPHSNDLPSIYVLCEFLDALG